MKANCQVNTHSYGTYYLLKDIRQTGLRYLPITRRRTLPTDGKLLAEKDTVSKALGFTAGIAFQINFGTVFPKRVVRT